MSGSADEIRKAFRHAFALLSRRIDLFTSLRLELLDRIAIKSKVAEIGVGNRDWASP